MALTTPMQQQKLPVPPKSGEDPVPRSRSQSPSRGGRVHTNYHIRTLAALAMAFVVLAFQVTLVGFMFRPVTMGVTRGQSEMPREAQDNFANRLMEVVDKRPIPPTHRQLWCVFDPDHGSYQLPDVPVEMCTAMLYCCLELTSRGVRYPRPEDEGHLGVDVFYTLRDRSHGLSLYVLMGDGVQTTAVFSNQVHGADPGELSDMAVTWLRSRQLDGLVFFYRSHRTSTRADADFYRHLRRIHDDLSRMGLFVTTAVSFNREDPTGVLSIPSLLKMVRSAPLLMYTHDLALPTDEAVCPMPFARGGASYQVSVSQLLADVNATLPMFQEDFARRLLFSVTLKAASYFLNYSRDFQEGASAVKLNSQATYSDMCEMVLKLNYDHFLSKHGDCLVVHKDRLWHSGFGSLSGKIFAVTTNFAGVVVFGMHADDFRGRCGEPHKLMKRVYRDLDQR